MMRKVYAEEQPRKQTINLRETPAKVERVIIDGVGRTKDDIVTKQVEQVFEAENFEDMIQRCQDAKNNMKKLGIFKTVRIEIDTYKGAKASSHGYQVKYHVQEMRFMTGGAHTQIGTNDGNLLFNLRIPNLFGRAEKVIAEYTYGTKHSRGLGLHLTRPVNGNTEVLFGATGYQGHSEYPWSGYKETDRGVGVDLSFPSLIGKHNIKWEGVWRDLRCMSNSTSFAVREQAGHSMKSSVKHTFMRDSRDDPILPNEGSLLKLTQEYAGVGGNARFFKHDIEVQANKELVLNSVFQLSLAGGVMRPLEPNKDIMIIDKFFLGGPLTLRGFNIKGVGPHSDGNALGGDMYCMGALHLYTPLPFRPGIGGFGDLFRSHFFINAGNCGNFQSFSFDQLTRENMDVFRNSLRLAYGAGIVLRLGGVARLELNYVVPIWIRQGDSANQGLQLGVGLTFL
ncbi:sorting and assembly machinery component 50 homolog [Ruditapes philippinarum]|uniref:sorting and assembly machinery component 50 homolog n=1 Tax=Ruditapes philippinarum TaxID=129788 RepID=UPI00295AA9EA|nr:sorting and assembly machinery component 50 homolog [Ruditapes philippinarum]